MAFDNTILKEQIRGLYPGQGFTDAELSVMSDKLIKFFAIGAQSLQKLKKTEEFIKQHEEDKNTSVFHNQSQNG